MNELRVALVRRGATLGANLTILCGIMIGQYAMIGAGTVVTRNVPDHALVVGDPRQVTDWRCQCGAELLVEGINA